MDGHRQVGEGLVQQCLPGAETILALGTMYFCDYGGGILHTEASSSWGLLHIHSKRHASSVILSLVLGNRKHFSSKNMSLGPICVHPRQKLS